ncbi:MAG: efflux RND transporter periplasmic adaptor subunit [Deltaproteobacteria bacterium]|nr:efflux RND transporter periplasmic adaptor subunit [Deltaproteobacteria bacterium]
MRNFFLVVGLAGILITCNLNVTRAEESMEFDGLITPFRLVQVGSAVQGLIESVHVERGDMVTKDQLLAKLQSGVEEAAVALARARIKMEAVIRAKREALEFAKRRLDRNKDLFLHNSIPNNQWDEIETERILAEHELAEAMENKELARLELRGAIEVVERMKIRSPINGVVVERFLNPAEYVENQPILKLAQIHPLKVEVILPVEMLGTVKAGMRAVVKPEAPVNGSYDATVKVVDKVLDAASSTFGVRLELPNPDYQLLPGLKCKVIFLGP